MRTNSSPPSRATVSQSRTVFFQPLPHLDQKLIAGQMTRGIIDILEVIKINKYQSTMIMIPIAPG